MSKTPSSQQQNQYSSLGAPMQSPPLIISDDRKAENDDGVAVKGCDEVCVINIDVKNEDEKKSATISNDDHDVVGDDGDDDDDDDEKVCRICQLKGSDHLGGGAGNNNVNLVLLGCACRGELGISHYHCALLWFQQKGNRTCEICGNPAKNIAVVEDDEFRVYGTDFDIITSELARSSGSAESDRGCSKCLSRIILTVVVLAFILPWAIRPNRFF